MAHEFKNKGVVDLKLYLKMRGITCTNLKRKDLLKLCQKADEMMLEVDPDCMSTSINDDITRKLFTVDGVIQHPDQLKGSADMNKFPSIQRIDVQSYLRKKKDQFEDTSTGSEFNIKNLDGYQIYEAGFVTEIDICDTNLANYFVIKMKVKPKQRQCDPITKLPYYAGWIIFQRPSKIWDAYCACKGGADGVCRHVVATLLEICDCSNEERETSCTSQPCLWTKKSKHVNDESTSVGISQ